MEGYYKETDRVRLIVDTDGDGKADKATVFADGFSHLHDGIGAGVLARGGKVWYTCIPDLYLLQDIKGTGTADVKKSLQTGYGIRTGFLGHDLHGLRFGPDGKLYFSVGDRGFNVKQGDRTIKETEMGAVLRCNPDGSELEVFARGLRNPQELAFDQYGNLFTGDNNSDGGDPARWVYVVEGGDSGWRVGFQFINSPNSRGVWMSERLCYPQFDGQAAFIIPPVALIANGPSGLAYYLGTGLPDKYQEHFFLCDFRGGSGSGVHSFALQPKGAGFDMIDRSHFIWDILCTDADFGIDGGLYVSDWVEGWNKTGKGRIYRVHQPELDNDSLVLETKKLISEGMAQRSTAELAQLLRHRDMRVRQEAQFALADKSATAIFQKVASQKESQLARLHAIWGLGQLARKHDAVNPLIELLGDGDAEVRAQAAKVLGDTRTGNAAPALVKLLAGSSPRPRFFAAIALGKFGASEAFGALVEMLRDNADRDIYLRHAGVMGLTGILNGGSKPPTVAAQNRDALLQLLAKDSSAAVRMAGVLVMRHLQRPEIAQFLEDKEPRIVVEAARAINDESIDAAMPKLAALISRASEFASWPSGKVEAPGPRDAIFRRVINANFRVGTPDAASSLATFAKAAAVPEAFRAEALSLLGEWAKPSGRDRITGLWRPLASRDASVASKAVEPILPELFRSSPTRLKVAAARVVAQLGLKSLAADLFELEKAISQPVTVRVEALKALSSLKAPKLEEAVKIALADSAELLRNEGTKIQARIKPKDAMAQIRVTLDKGSIREKQTAFATLGTMPGSDPDEILSTWLDKLLAKKVPTELQLDLIEAAAKRSNVSIKEKIHKYDAGRDPADDLRAFRECLAGGDAKEGRTVFMEKPEASCMRCHKVGTEGEGEAGPNLAGIASRQPREYMLESIVFPNKQIAKGYETLVVTLKNGAAYAGIVKNETETTLELNSPEDGLLKINKADIKTRDHGLSGMPEELGQILTKRDIRNLVEFLCANK